MPLSRARSLHRAAVAVTAAAAAVTVPLATPALAESAAAVRASTAHTSAAHTAARAVAPGITVRQQSWEDDNGLPEQSALMTLDLGNSHVHLGGWVGGGVLASSYKQLGSVLAAAPATTVGIVNASFFDLDDLRQPAQGGVVVNGAVLKNPNYGGNDNFYVRADGTAGIGPVTYIGAVRVPARKGSIAARAIYAVNTPTKRSNQTLTLVSPALSHMFAPGGCTESLFTAAAKGTYRLVSTTSTGSAHRSTHQLAHVSSGHIALVGCGQAGTWLKGLARSSVVTASGYLAEGTNRAAKAPKASRRIQTLVTGAEQILRNGKSFHDTSDHNIGGLNAETFACVSRDTTHVLLGVVGQTWDFEGYDTGSSGVSIAGLRTYASGLGCYSAVALDGGGSTTLDYRPRGTSKVVHGIAPTYGDERQLNNALVVSYR